MRMVMSVMVVAGMIVGSAQAALTTSEELHVGSSNDFPVSATDLINIGQCIQSYEGNGGNDSAVIDGSSGLENYWGGVCFCVWHELRFGRGIGHHERSPRV